MAETMSALRTRAKELDIKVPVGTTKAALIALIASGERSLVAPTGDTPSGAGRANAHYSAGEALSNPELEPTKMMDAIIHDEETSEQRKARFTREAKAQIERERIQAEVRKAAQIEDQKLKQINKHVLTYDIVDMERQCKAILEPTGCHFQVDRNEDGLVGTYHMWGVGKSDSGNLAQPLPTILRNVRLFRNVKSYADMPKVQAEDMGAVRSAWTGQPMETLVHKVGEPHQKPAEEMSDVSPDELSDAAIV